MPRQAVWLVAVWCLVTPACVVEPASAPAQTPLGEQPWLNPALPPDQRADLAEAQMTLAEKVAMTSGLEICAGLAEGYVPGVARLGIPDLAMAGAGMGVTNVCRSKVEGGDTELPAPIAMAASWDPQAAFADGALIGTEARDRRFDVALGGDVNLARDPRNGRTFEGEGEDPLLAGTIVGAQLVGTRSMHVATTIKHFAMNDEEAYRGTQSSNVDERTMRELELRAFEIGIERGGVDAVMCSYNRVNGVPACENPHLLGQVLKRDWDFRGWVMTDWWACGPPLTWSPSDFCQTAQAAAAGLDQEQPQPGFFGPALVPAVVSGAVPQPKLDQIVHRILRSLFAAGVVDDPPAARPIDAAAGAAVAQDMEERAAVLLKDAGGVLPLDRARLRSIAAIGAPAAAAPPEPPAPVTSQNYGSSVHVDPIDPDTPLQGLHDGAPDAQVRYSDGSSIAAAAALARSSDVAIVYATDSQGEGTNMPSLALDQNADALIAAVAAANPRTIVVLMSGSAVTMPWLGSVPAVLEAWYPGERGGHAIAHLLFGDANPSGRLPLSFPTREADLPTAGSPLAWPGNASDIEYSEGLFSGYRWYDAKHIAPLFPFGFGLAYGASFASSGFKIAPARIAVPVTAANGSASMREEIAHVQFSVHERGTRPAIAVPELYVGFPAGLGEPPKRLAGWAKVAMTPGRTRTLSIDLDVRSLAIWNAKAGGWIVAPGSYPICVGSSAGDVQRAGILVVGNATTSTTDACPVRPTWARGPQRRLNTRRHRRRTRRLATSRRAA